MMGGLAYSRGDRRTRLRRGALSIPLHRREQKRFLVILAGGTSIVVPQISQGLGCLAYALIQIFYHGLDVLVRLDLFAVDVAG